MSRRARFRIPDYPRDRPTARQVAAIVRDYLDGGGLALHLFEDGNIGDGALRACQDHARHLFDLRGHWIAEYLLRLTSTQRRKVLALSRVAPVQVWDEPPSVRAFEARVLLSRPCGLVAPDALRALGLETFSPWYDVAWTPTIVTPEWFARHMLPG